MRRRWPWVAGVGHGDWLANACSSRRPAMSEWQVSKP
jgi:hypothetical protein